jgi:hypothetical protein
MPPKQNSKAKQAEDKTFGLKNKNKSKKVQQYVQQVVSQVIDGIDNRPKKEEISKKLMHKKSRRIGKKKSVWRRNERERFRLYFNRQLFNPKCRLV